MNSQKENPYPARTPFKSSTGRTGFKVASPELRIFIFCALSAALSHLGFLTLLTAVPLLLAGLTTPAKKFWIGSILVGFLHLGVSLQLPWVDYGGIFYFVALGLAGLCRYAIKEAWTPVETLLKVGLIFIGTFLALVVFGEIFLAKGPIALMEESLLEGIKRYSEQDIVKSFLKKPTEESAAIVNYINNPQSLVEWFFSYVLAFAVSSGFLWVWITVTFVLRNAITWKYHTPYPYGIRELTTFRVPFEVVYGVIAGMILLAVEVFFQGPAWTGIIGKNILIILSVFYFFQGFGVVIDYLTRLRVLGPLRTFVILLIIFFAIQLVILIGLFDTWINFRKFFVGASEGDDR